MATGDLNWGFYLFPRAHAASPGYGGLLVTIRDGKATDAFTPDVMICRMGDDLGYPEWVELTGASGLVPYSEWFEWLED